MRSLGADRRPARLAPHRPWVEAAWVAGLLVFFTLLQVTIVEGITVLRGSADLVVVLVICVAILRGPEAGAVTGFAGGLLLDVLGLGRIGASSLVLVLVGFLIGQWRSASRDRAPLRPLIAVAAGALLYALGTLLTPYLTAGGGSITADVLLVAIPSAMLDVLVAIALLPLLRRILPVARQTPISESVAARSVPV